MSPKKRIGELLIEAGVIDDAMLQSALGHQRRWGGRLGQALLDLKMLSEGVLVETLARKSGFEVARLSELEPYALEQALKLVPGELALRANVFPMAADTSTLTVAMSDPTNLSLTDELAFRTGRRVKVTIGGDREIAEAIRFHYRAKDEAPGAISIDLENTGEGLSLTAPFEGGSTEDMRAMLEPAQAMTPRPSPLPPVVSAPPIPARPAVSPPPPPVAPAALTPPPARPSAPPVLGRAPTAAALPAARPAPPARQVTGTFPPVPAPPSRQVTGTFPAVPAPPAPRPAPAPPAAARPVPAPPQAPPPARPPTPAAAPAPAAPPGARPALEAIEAARDALLGAIPRGGFTPEDPIEELQPAPLEEGEPLPLESLLEEEMVEGRVALRELSPRDVAILDALERLANGQEDAGSPLRPGQAAAALLRLLVKKKLISEAELLDELSRR